MHVNVRMDYTPLLTKLKEKQISVYKLVEYGIPHKTLYNIRQGKIITVETLAKFAYILDCNISDLVRFEYNITK